MSLYRISFDLFFSLPAGTNREGRANYEEYVRIKRVVMIALHNIFNYSVI